MNTHHSMPEKTSRDQWRAWRAASGPLLRRTAPRWGAAIALLAGFWLAGAYFAKRYDTLAPRPGLDKFALRDFVRRGQDIPDGENAAAIYLEADKQVKSLSKANPDFDQALKRFSDLVWRGQEEKRREWRLPPGFAGEVERIAAQVRDAGQRPKCVFPLSKPRQTYYIWRTPADLAALLGARVWTAARQGDGPAWQQAVQDAMAFLETTGRDKTTVVTEMHRRMLGALVNGMEEAVNSGAAKDGAFLAQWDARLAALRPMDAFEPLLAMAWSTMDFQHAMLFYGTWARYFPETLLSGETLYPKALDVPYNAGGFSARDLALTSDYLSELLRLSRAGGPNAWYETWSCMARNAGHGEGLGRELAPNFSSLCGDIVRTSWGGTPGTLYANDGCVRMLRAMIRVMRQGCDPSGRLYPPEQLRVLLTDFPCPTTGEPIEVRGYANGCFLVYRAAYDPKPRRDYWELRVQIVPPPSVPPQADAST